jgi:hypothetical protein
VKCRGDELVADVGDGIYVIDLIGAGVSIVTGDGSRGASGFRIRNGQLCEPLTEMTIAGNLRDMFRSLRSPTISLSRCGERPTVAIEGDRRGAMSAEALGAELQLLTSAARTPPPCARLSEEAGQGVAEGPELAGVRGRHRGE